jgi:hypothetical protein
MRGELLAVQSAIWPDIWVKLSKHKAAPKDLFSELYAALVPQPIPPNEPEASANLGPNGELVDPADIAARGKFELDQLAFNAARSDWEEAASGSPKARTRFRRELPIHVQSEADAVRVLEAAFDTVLDIGGDELASFYFNTVVRFIEKFSLRYDLRQPFSLHPTLPGIFARLVSQLKVASLGDAALHNAMLDFEESIRDIRSDSSPNRIKTCISKQMNLIEAIGQRAPGVKGNTLGLICDQVGTWPHNKVRDCVKNLYGFASDYPGIRHAGQPANQLRDIDMRDLIAVSVMMVGFSPYLTDLITAGDVYSNAAVGAP